VGPARSQEQRRPPPRERARPAASATREAPGREAAPLRAQPSAEHRVPGLGEARPQYGPGRPSQPPPRVGKALRDALPVPRHERAAGSARQGPEMGCGGLRMPGLPAGDMGHRAGEGLRADQASPGVAPPGALWTASSIVQRLGLPQPERSEA
jgi:hypothetical protein